MRSRGQAEAKGASNSARKEGNRETGKAEPGIFKDAGGLFDSVSGLPGGGM